MSLFVSGLVLGAAEQLGDHVADVVDELEVLDGEVVLERRGDVMLAEEGDLK